MLSRPFLFLVFACSAQSVVKRQQDGSTPSGKTDPSTITDCTYWVNVQPKDTCSSITGFYRITFQDFVRFNPSLKGDCSGLTRGYSYCIEENFGLGPIVITKSPSITAIANTVKPKLSTSTSTALSPLQSGIISTCQYFYKVVSGDGCQTIVDRYGTFTLSDFYAWNPAVGSSCQSLLLGYYVCVGIPSTPTVRPTNARTTTASGLSLIQTGIRSDCRNYYQAISGDTCDAITAKFRTFSTAEFESWNPAVGSTCSFLFAGYYYCVAIPGTPPQPPSPPPRASQTFVVKGPQPQQPGTIANCKQYYKVVAGDSCFALERKFDLSADQFNFWNPGVGDDCKTLFLGYYICVGL